MGIGLLTLMTAAAEGGACASGADRSALLLELEAAALEGRIEEAEGVKHRILLALACGELVDRGWLARWWLGEAVVSSLHGDEQPTDDALAAAARLAPEVWVEGYGPAFRSRQLAAPTTPGRGRVLLDLVVDGAVPEGSFLVVAVDGEVVQGMRVELSSGYHLLQAGFAVSDIRYANLVYVVTSQDLVVRGVLPGDAIVQTGPVLPIKPPPRKPPLLGTAGAVMGLGATVTAVLALEQNRAMRTAHTEGELTAAYKTQRALGGTSYALMGAAVACLGLEFAF